MCFTYFCCTSTVQIPRSNNSNQKPLITNKKSLDSILKEYVDNGSYPILYARIENIDGCSSGDNLDTYFTNNPSVSSIKMSGNQLG